MEHMHSRQDGKVGVSALIAIVLLSLGLIGCAGFAVWAFGQRQDYKTNVDKKIATAVAENTKTVQAADAKTYAEQAQYPLKTYAGPEAYGSVTLSYPKTWSAYNASTNSSSNPVDFYAHPDVVPAVGADNSNFALRMQVVSQQYNTVAKQYANQLKQGTVTISAYVLPNNKTVTGVRIDGQIDTDKKGSLVLLPLRDKTLKIWTESTTYADQFDKIILANAHFTP
jgi:hypothetical protein